MAPPETPKARGSTRTEAELDGETEVDASMARRRGRSARQRGWGPARSVRVSEWSGGGPASRGPMRRADCARPLRVYAYIAPYHGGPTRISSTNGAGDAA
ncbi:MAG: hypothetical protein ACK6CU_11125 [Deltaproteobacteria bacterium]